MSQAHGGALGNLSRFGVMVSRLRCEGQDKHDPIHSVGIIVGRSAMKGIHTHEQGIAGTPIAGRGIHHWIAVCFAQACMIAATAIVQAGTNARGTHDGGRILQLDKNTPQGIKSSSILQGGGLGTDIFVILLIRGTVCGCNGRQFHQGRIRSHDLTYQFPTRTTQRIEKRQNQQRKTCAQPYTRPVARKCNKESKSLWSLLSGKTTEPPTAHSRRSLQTSRTTSPLAHRLHNTTQYNTTLDTLYTYVNCG